MEGLDTNSARYDYHTMPVLLDGQTCQTTQARSMDGYQKIIRTSINDKREKIGIVCLVFLKDNIEKFIFIDRNGTCIQFNRRKS